MDMELPEAEQADGEVLLLQRVAAGDRDALRGMVAVLDASFGPRGARIGQMVRSLPGMLTALVTFVESTDDEVTCDALHCIANICSDGLDIQSDLSKRQLLAEPGGAESIFSLLTDDEAEMSCRIGAAACLQNLCSDAAWAFVLAAESELVADIEHMIHTGAQREPTLVRYALGALANAARVAANTAGCKGFNLSEATWRLVDARREASEEESNARSQALTKLRAAVRLKRPTRRAQPLMHGEDLVSSVPSATPSVRSSGSSSDSVGSSSSDSVSSSVGSSVGSSVDSSVGSNVGSGEQSDGSCLSPEGCPRRGGGASGESTTQPAGGGRTTTTTTTQSHAAAQPSSSAPEPSEEPVVQSPSPLAGASLAPTTAPTASLQPRMPLPSEPHSSAANAAANANANAPPMPLPRLTPRGLMLTANAEAGGTAGAESDAAEARGGGTGRGLSGWGGVRQIAMARVARVPPPPKWPTVEKLPVTVPKVTPRLDQLSAPKRPVVDANLVATPRSRRHSKELMPGSSPPSPPLSRAPPPAQIGAPPGSPHPPNPPSPLGSTSPQRRRTGHMDMDMGQPLSPVSGGAAPNNHPGSLDVQHASRKGGAAGAATSLPPLIRM